MGQFIRFGVLSWLLILPSLCLADATVAEMWPHKCKELKQKYLTDPVLKITFSKKPVVKASVDSWYLDWQGLVLPLPQTQYDTIAISRDAEGNHAIYLGNAKKNISLTLQQHPANSETLHSGNREMTRSELTLLGYEKTPDDLSCQAGSWQQEAPVADALII